MFRAEPIRPHRRAGLLTPIRLATVLLVTTLTAIGANPAAAEPVSDALPIGVEASFMVFDRETGDSSVQFDAHKQYRSASVVKLLIALDYLESHDLSLTTPSDDLARLQAMLRSSDDDAASYLWIENGWDKIIERMVAKLGLTDTAPPATRGMWGYTAISAADVVTIYRYILDTANPAIRDFMMSNLHQSTKCGKDGFDQSFGIARALAHQPRAVKQGWSGFGDEPDKVCAPGNPKPPIPQGALNTAATGPVVFGEDGVRETWSLTQGTTPADGPVINLKKRAMHTTGTVGEHDEKIVVLLTLEPTGTTWDDAAQRLTLLTKTIDLADWGAATGFGAR
ncbi:hypothetical protein ACFQZZ_21495 [Nocardia sp. GCM10030253]|uniref:hypothetical protein n=1 Tax=Nocardia sp. GCM10030253 TaxID=3273404 RepID=UPI003642BC17